MKDDHYYVELTQREYSEILSSLKSELKRVEKINEKNYGYYDEQVEEVERLVSKIQNLNPVWLAKEREKNN